MISHVTAEPSPVGHRTSDESSDAPRAPQPGEKGPLSRLLGLLLLFKMFCLQNISWLMSVAFHGALTLSIAGIAFHYKEKHDGLGIEAGAFDGAGEQGFDNVLGADQQAAAGGGKPFESVIQPAEMSQAGGELTALNELAKLGMEGGEAGDGGEGGGSGGGRGSGRGLGTGLGAGFFGSKGKGKSFVYIVDASGSMMGSRFSKVKTELVQSINKLTEQQKFFIFFFNDRTIPMFDPKPAKGMIAANKNNKQRASAWVRKHEPKSLTNPTLALRQALEMKPEVIFLLTDGELDDGVNDISAAVRQMIRDNNKSNVIIHTIAFENEDATTTLEAIAKENNGTFRLVK